LPSAMDNRPLKFDEWEGRINQVVYVSATPSDYELEKTGGEVVEQIIRPTGLLDPVCEVVPASGQVAHLLEQVKERRSMGDRVLVTALTKRLAEDLAAYFCDKGIATKWLHSELDAFERVELLRDLRLGAFDCLIGVNLLREGLDLPEVSLVAILDADKQGFLRSETALVQTIGRAARNANAKVILYGDRVSEAMKHALEETARRRSIQEAYNAEHGIVPTTVYKEVKMGIERDADERDAKTRAAGAPKDVELITQDMVTDLQTKMIEAAENLDFEQAGFLRDRITLLENHIGEPLDKVDSAGKSRGKGRRGKGKRKNTRVPRPKKEH